MASVRTNPVPAGRYWIDVHGSNIPLFQLWLQDHHDLLDVENAEDFTTPGAGSRWWILWNQFAPVEFDFKRFGFPTEAGPEVHSAADTVQTTPPEDALTILKQEGANALEFGEQAGKVLLLAAILYALSR